MTPEGDAPTPTPGWYEHHGKKSWWDGSKWAESTPRPPRKGPPVWAWVVIVVVVIGIIGAAGSGSDDKQSSSDKPLPATTIAESTPPSAAETEPRPPPPPAAPASCGKKATDECTPHVGFGGSVRVDALIWKVTNVRVSETLGDQTYGLGEKADGRFVVVSLHVHSDKNESATFSSDIAKLETGGNTYDTDTDGTVAAMGAGEQPFFLEDIGPDADVNGKVVFDVPEKVLQRKVEIRFNEIGFGSTHGYIRLPSSSLR